MQPDSHSEMLNECYLTSAESNPSVHRGSVEIATAAQSDK